MSAIEGVLAGIKMRRDGDRQAVQDAEAADDLAAKREDRAFQRSERARILQLRADMAAAAAPAEVDETPVAVPIGSRDEPQAPEARIRAAGRTFGTRAEADAAAAEHNTPRARMERQAAVLDQAGDPTAAQALRTTQRQGQLADLNLSTAEAAAGRDKKLRELGSLLIKGGWQAVPEAYARYDDGNTAKVIEDGKGGATVVSIGPDGKELGRKAFASMPEFFGQLAGTFDPQKWIDSEDKKAETARQQANVDREFKRREGESDRDFQLRKAEAERRARHDSAMLANDTARVGIARMASMPKDPVAATPESTFDAKTAAEIAKDQVQKEADEARAAGKTWTAQQIAQRQDAIVQAARQQHTVRFIESAATRALSRTQADPEAYAAEFEKAQALGIPLKRLGEMGFRAPQRQQQPGAVAPNAPAPAAATQQPAAQPGAAAVVPFSEFVAQNITTPEGKRAISQRVMKELPEIQFRIKGITDVMALPLVSGAVKSKLKGQLDQLSQDAEMMQAFAAGNPGI